MVRANIDIRLFTNTNLVAKTRDSVAASMGIERKIVQSTISEPIAIIYDMSDLALHICAFHTSSILDFGNEPNFRKI